MSLLLKRVERSGGVAFEVVVALGGVFDLGGTLGTTGGLGLVGGITAGGVVGLGGVFDLGGYLYPFVPRLLYYPYPCHHHPFPFYLDPLTHFGL